VAGAQVAPNRSTTYLHPTDVQDARALWVNPAGLATVREASVHLDVTVGDPGARGRLRQLTAGFNSRGLSLGYQRDVFDGGVRGHTYRLGLGGSSAGLAVGVAMALYRGDTKGTGFDLGIRYDLGSAVTLGGVIANVGQPEVRGFRQRTEFLPAATFHPLGPKAALSAHARITTAEVVSYSFGVRWRWAMRRPLQLLARLDTDRALRRGAFAFGLSLGGSDMLGIVAATPGDVSGVEAVSVYGVSTRSLVTRRR
jgi:hypothetical protein